MQSAVFGAVLFVSNVYTVDRLVLLAVNLVGVLLGIWYEEKRLVTKFEGYKDYMKKVPYRLIPYVF